MRVYSPTLSSCFEKSAEHKIDLMQQHHHNYQDDRELWSLPIKRSFFFAFILVTLFMQHYVITAAADDGRISGFLDGVRNGFRSRMRSPKITSIHILQPVPESLAKQQHDGQPINMITSTADNKTNIPQGGKFEIRSVSGEPNYKSVNLTWEVEFVPSEQDAVTNSSREVEPPSSFQVFFCEIESFGPHRCRSKILNDTTSLQMYDNMDNDLEEMGQTRQLRQYMTQVDNLRMATKYSFHIRSAPKNRIMKLTGRSELFDNEVEGEDFLSSCVEQGQTIIIPTKGFSAQATQCLPTASEIEVETGPYFGGKIVVDGGNCGIKGDPNDIKDKYVMRIDHKTCGSMVKPETNTVETFITVQENLGIFTHSTRRFAVVCSYQFGLQTVRASFSVPGRGGVPAVQQDHYEEEERMGRGLKPMRYVDKSALILKETNTSETENTNASEETVAAMVEEMDNTTVKYINSEAVATDDTTNTVATLENIIPEVNDENIKQTQTEVNENEIQNNIVAQQESEIKHAKDNKESSSNLTTTVANISDEHEKFSAKFGKLTSDLQNEGEDESGDYGAAPKGRGFGSCVELVTLNIGSVLLTVLLSVILIGIFLYFLYRETNLPPPVFTMSSNTTTIIKRQHQHMHLHEEDKLPRTLGTKDQNTLA